MSIAPGINRVYYSPMSMKDWAQYYGMQTGRGARGMTFFRGSPFQRGNGIGSIFSGLLRAAMPAAKSALKTVGKQALQAGLSTGVDVLNGANVGDSLKTHGKKAAANVLTKARKNVAGAKGGKRKKRVQTGRGIGVQLSARGLRGKPINRTRKRRKAVKKDFLSF